MKNLSELEITWPRRETTKGAVTLAPWREADVPVLQRLLNAALESNDGFPYPPGLDEAEFRRLWLAGQAVTARYGDTPVGSFYLKPNQPFRGAHVANAGYLVAPEWRNLGLGRLMAEFSMELALRLGYRALQFNLVYADNAPARRLYWALGFNEVGVLPGAVARGDGRFVDAVIYYTWLTESRAGL